MDLWAFATYDLKIPHFGRLSPRQFVALAARHREDLRRADLRSAIVAHTIYSLLKSKKMPRRKVEHFMPRERKAPVSPDQLLRKVEALNLLFGGTDVRSGTQPNARPAVGRTRPS